ncbi:hypothetical protein BRADI_1g28273v3 [Brachypodium distachyon]|uniref:Uncharacterized protein n=1 Tax=Brachypodium distachyon TaxID=15368 RepID=A0A0Q3NG22_BRADI|nr:hypothetical protein BRADI_1g28273v3 [Brachypodium distachyon]
MAAAVLPPLLPTPPSSAMLPILPTPPRSKMLPLLPTPCGLAMLPKPGRADSVERWDANKNSASHSSASSSSSGGAGIPGRAGSFERWDSKKLGKSSTPMDQGRRSETETSNKRPPSRASSAEQTAASKEITEPAAAFAGPNFFATPEPSMLPMPTSLLRAH